MKFHLTIAEAKHALEKTALPYLKMMQHGSMKVEYYAPKGCDQQTPHKQDELYIIVSGSAEFYRAGEYVGCKEGDVLFVPAGMEHMFQHFTNDFAAWVIFYGKEGGEVEKIK